MENKDLNKNLQVIIQMIKNLHENEKLKLLHILDKQIKKGSENNE